jgi:hypothetical protein
MKHVSALAILLSLCELTSAFGQQGANSSGTLTLLGLDSKTAGVTQNTVATPLEFLADPSVGGGDMFDITVSDPGGCYQPRSTGQRHNNSAKRRQHGLHV